MVTLIEREFVVDVSLPRSWEHLARVEQWPSWAPHIKRIELQPPSELGPESTGVIHLSNGMKPAFRMTEFNPPRSWKWVGRFLWVTVIYDHQFEEVDAGHTKLLDWLRGEKTGWLSRLDAHGGQSFRNLLAK